MATVCGVGVTSDAFKEVSKEACFGLQPKGWIKSYQNREVSSVNMYGSVNHSDEQCYVYRCPTK